MLLSPQVTEAVGDPDQSVRIARPSDQVFIEHLQRTYSSEVGFVPNSIIADKIARGMYYLISLRAQPAGFAYVTGGVNKAVHIIQHAVCEELWLNGYGSALLAAIAARAAAAPFPAITITVREDIPTHGFWLASGAKAVRLRPGGKTRRKMLIDYVINSDQVVRLSHLTKEFQSWFL